VSPPGSFERPPPDPWWIKRRILWWCVDLQTLVGVKHPLIGVKVASTK
jgi:hypothetical protein